MKLFKEFKEFAIKGNMFDMAVGIVIGVAFNAIINSLVKDIISPFFGLFIGKVKFHNLSVVLQDEMLDESGNVVQELIAINYGLFMQVILNFLIIAGTIFFVIKLFNRLKNKANDEKDQTVPTPKDIQLLSEIRDLLKHK